MGEPVVRLVLVLYSLAASLGVPLFVESSLRMGDEELRRRRLTLATRLVFTLWLLVPLASISVLEPRLLLTEDPSALVWIGPTWLLSSCAHLLFAALRLRGTGFRVELVEVGARELLLELRDQLCCVGLPEELLTRGVMVGLAVPLIGVPGAVLLSSAAFGLVHFIHERSPSRFAETSIAGAVYSLGLIRSGSVWVPAAAHVLVNLTFSCVRLSRAERA